MKTDEDKSLVAERAAANSRQGRVRCHGRCPRWDGEPEKNAPTNGAGPEGTPPRRQRYGELGRVVYRRENEGFYDSGGGFSHSGCKVLIP